MVIKILVNWAEQKIVHSDQHRGSSQFVRLLELGYEEVGSVTIEPENHRVFWKPQWFDPKAKYQKPN